jgi:hypothetical protein
MRVGLALFILLTCSIASAQNAPPTTADDLAAQTALLKAQQAYYDQLLATSKSQQAAATAAILNATTSLTVETQLQQAAMSKDLALAAAIKGSGLTAATGKSGNITIAAGTASLLPLQAGGLKAIDNLADQVCKDLRAANVRDAFIPPPNFESLVEKGTVDVIQLRSLHEAATSGTAEFAAVQLQVAGTAIAGAMISAEYLAGGVQALSMLFRNDYSVSVMSNSRPNLFEQRLAASCGGDVISYNIEGVLRLNGAKILAKWLPDMAKFAQLYDTANDQVTASVASITAERTAVATDNTLDATAKAAKLKLIDTRLQAFAAKQDKLAKYKSVNGAIKAYLSGLTPTSSVFDSLTWSQDTLFDLGGVPAELTKPRLLERPRFVFSLTVQDATVTKSSVFSSSQVKGLSSVEAYYAVMEKDQVKLSGVYTQTVNTPAFSFHNASLPGYYARLPPLKTDSSSAVKPPAVQP